MKTWTLDEMMAEEPCYTRKEMIEAFQGAERLSLLDILNREDIPAADRLWVAFRPTSLSTEQQRIVTNRIVARAATNGIAEWKVRWEVGWEVAESAAWEAGEAAAWIEKTGTVEEAARAREKEYLLQIADIVAVVTEGEIIHAPSQID